MSKMHRARNLYYRNWYYRGLSNFIQRTKPLPPSSPVPLVPAFVSSFASIVDWMHMDAASSNTSPSICFIRLSSKEAEAFCSRAKTSIGLISIDVSESDQFCTLFSLSSLPPSLPPLSHPALSDTDNPTPSNTRSVSQITIAHTIDPESAFR